MIVNYRKRICYCYKDNKDYKFIQNNKLLDCFYHSRMKRFVPYDYKKFDDIEIFDINENAIARHRGKCFHIDLRKTLKRVNCGDIIKIISDYGCFFDDSGYSTILYIGSNNNDEFIISSSILKHEDDSKNIGIHYCSKNGWTI